MYGLATDLELAGFVGNDSIGVFVEVEGTISAVEAFAHRLAADAPPAAVITEVMTSALEPTGERGFTILTSQPGRSTTLVSPDLDVCDECLAEMSDRKNRRDQYPFINCTNCGPRFSIIRATPYDRASTTMAEFAMCTLCEAEYSDPLDRRFHAQPNACASCGPEVWLVRGGSVVADDAVATTRSIIASGGTVAIKGLGGFHLACEATDAGAVRKLRHRKGRAAKPFAVMAADLDTAREIADVDDIAADLLTSRAHPIVVMPSKPANALAPEVAPGNTTIGIMLPYTPLHHLLMQPGDVWVMTSGNRSSEPIVIDNNSAADRLGELSDAMLLHNRTIQRPVDDSVVRSYAGGVFPIRRSRGYAPYPVRLDFESRPTLAVGGELKATLAVAAGSLAFMSQHIGDMENVETLDAFATTAHDLANLFRIEPEVIVCDLHPRYLSREWAHSNADGRPVIEVQHHHAHVASLLAEHRRNEPVIGFAFDGTGYGLDGTIWGGEVLVGDLYGFERAGHLATFGLPGGDAAVERPYRAALSLLKRFGLPWNIDLPGVAAAGEVERSIIDHQLESGLNSVLTSSIGRLFDGVSSLAGVCQNVSYEGQAAIELEAIADMSLKGRPYEFVVRDSDGTLVLDPSPVLAAVARDTLAGAARGAISASFHRGLAMAVRDLAVAVREATDVSLVALSGGVFQNALLTQLTVEALSVANFEVLTHQQVPANDGGLALGQIALAAHHS